MNGGDFKNASSNQLSASYAPELAVSVDARMGITTGISASDRALTLRALARTSDPKLDLVMPGHIFPLRAKNGGVLIRAGIAEAALDLLKLARSQIASDARSSHTRDVGAIIHCLDEKGEILNQAGLDRLASEHGFPQVKISDIIQYRLSNESLVEKVAESNLPVEDSGHFRAIVFRSLVDGAEHLALVKGEISQQTDAQLSAPVMTRMQAENRLGDLLGVQNVRDGSSRQFVSSRKLIGDALKRLEQQGRGVFVYLRHPRKSRLQQEIEALSTNVSSRPQMELREFGMGIQILKQLGVKRISLLSNSQRDVPRLSAFNLEIVDRIHYSPATNND